MAKFWTGPYEIFTEVVILEGLPTVIWFRICMMRAHFDPEQHRRYETWRENNLKVIKKKIVLKR